MYLRQIQYWKDNETNKTIEIVQLLKSWKLPQFNWKSIRKKLEQLKKFRKFQKKRKNWKNEKMKKLKNEKMKKWKNEKMKKWKNEKSSENGKNFWRGNWYRPEDCAIPTLWLNHTFLSKNTYNCYLILHR